MQNAAHCGTVVRRLNLLEISGNQSFLTPLEGRQKWPFSASDLTAVAGPGSRILVTARAPSGQSHTDDLA